MPYDVARLQFDVAQIQHSQAGFGTGRLIARNIILTAAHTLQKLDGSGPALDNWLFRLAGEQSELHGWPFWRGNRVVWRNDRLDLALIQVMDKWDSYLGSENVAPDCRSPR